MSELSDGNAVRREELARRICGLMGWEYQTSPIWKGIRKLAVAEAIAVGLDKLEEICKRLENSRELTKED